MNRVDTVLFDWDGTLVDTAQAAFDAFQKSFRDLGIQFDFDLYERIYSPDWRRMYQMLQLPVDKWQEAEDLWLHYYGLQASEMVCGARQALNELSGAGYSLGIVTSGSQLRVQCEIEKFGLAEVFRAVVCNEDVTNKKPHPEGLETAMSRMGKRHKVCCYVGDCPEDVEMGKRAGVLTIGICGRYPNSRNVKNSNPDFYFESILQLLEHFQLNHLRIGM
jgi:HAD superfamily hydrolase (TIGR01549 family)